MTRGLVVAFVLLLLGPGAQDPAPLRTFYLNNQVACSDAAGWGTTEEKPFCTLKYVASWWRGGDLFLLASKRDGSGPVEFTRGGTATAPVTIRGVGGRPVIGSFTDLDDEAFVATDVPGVFLLAGAPSGNVWATRFPPIEVDDPNQSKYTMVDTDGPLQMAAAPDDATLAKIEGTYRHGLDGLRVHPYGSQKPSVTSSDLVVGQGRAMNFTGQSNYLIFEHLATSYSGSVYSFMITGTGHVFRDMHWYGVPLTLKGMKSRVENYLVTHVHQRDASGDWTWHYKGTGMGAIIDGPDHQLLNGEIRHSWNASIDSELGAERLVIDRVTLHGSPNHCWATGPGVTVRNYKTYNCQDSTWIIEQPNVVLEHFIAPDTDFSFRGTTASSGWVTIRHSIFTGTFTYVSGALPQYCDYEAKSVVEYSLLKSDARIERCGTGVYVPIQKYIEDCTSGAITGCIQFRNNKFFTNWSEVITGGARVPNTDEWDVTLTPTSPAKDIGGTNGTATDLIGVARPQPPGGLRDAGVYEAEDKPKPVDCVMSDWGPWVPTSDYTYANWAQTRSEGRKRSVTTPPANGGAACPTELTETRQVVEACATITVTPQLTITCNVAAARKQ